MSDARGIVLDSIRRGLARSGFGAAHRAEAEKRLRNPRHGPIPARSDGSAADRLALFIAEAERVNAAVLRAAEPAGIPAALADWLAGQELPRVVRHAPDPWLAGLPWDGVEGLAVSRGAAGDDVPVGVSLAFAGVAETATLVLLSGPDSPVTLNFLPDTHVVVLPTDRLVGTYEEAWGLLRDRARDAGAKARHLPVMPRTVNWITGPSRTADIEQTLLLGAHGPRRLLIVIVGE